ncbi:hypothetical protein GUITHDRAFT_100721 [Guillardia theta CCMP2712]|uniref:WW domain-containing protein n=2 Tax=Guillardia theta TaxID=55529 RepID=L1JZX4_GUITC|nr:hypothetical protein GUITHDRAFT_100721 [Guillardia theta CCMP2712]EKX53750.1 hypothetical protein GUITHDRAFT_100721 [Guillardia theta CCMP2712]|mmetsp:Transcript_46624/g.146168  ORF Transcript_46624/g.146168 Transcript_46624/m.146168 type:complete len:303 (+) Transcript_46624:53-961(+)|eukprot:XP_005840730.1 hypothetical protein GUITHDRAFT_100721 [Guillardia theta CCMP2712]
MDAFAAYESGSDEEPAKTSAQPQGGSSKPRRTLTLPLPSLKHPPASTTADDDDDDEEDEKLFRSSRRGGGLLASLPAPKNDTSTVRQLVSTKADSDIFEDLALKKKKKPSHLAAAIFEKRVQDTRENEDKARAAELEAQEEAQQEELQPVEPLPEGWAAAWDEASGAFYYYHTSGVTQWEHPSHPSEDAGASAHLPEELQRELKMQAKRAMAKGEEVVPQEIAPVAVTVADMMAGEKHGQYISYAAAYHTPMKVTGTTSMMAKRKHHITDVLHQAAANELEYLERAAESKRNRQQVNSRYGW